MPGDRRPNEPQRPQEQLVALLRREPAPSMHLDIARVVALGRRRARRRAAGVAVAACAAAVAAVALGSSLLSAPGNDTTTPAGTSTVSRPDAGESTGTGSRDVAAAGRRTLTVGDATYTFSAGDELMTIDVVRNGDRQRSVAGLVGGTAAWRVIDGTGGQKVLAGIVPGVAGAIDLRPVPGRDVPRHSVKLSAGRDFTAFVVTFAQPLDTQTPAADVGWSSSGPATTWILGDDPPMAALAVTMEGRGDAPLAPYDLTRTGPPATAPTGSVVIFVDLPDGRIGGTAVVTLQEDVVVKDPAGLTAQLTGADPETSAARGVFELTDGRTFAWGVAPSGAEGAVAHLDGGAKAGTPVLEPMLEKWTAYAVQVDGSPAQVNGVTIPLGSARGALDVIG